MFGVGSTTTSLPFSEALPKKIFPCWESQGLHWSAGHCNSDTRSVVHITAALLLLALQICLRPRGFLGQSARLVCLHIFPIIGNNGGFLHWFRWRMGAPSLGAIELLPVQNLEVILGRGSSSYSANSMPLPPTPPPKPTEGTLRDFPFAIFFSPLKWRMWAPWPNLFETFIHLRQI